MIFEDPEKLLMLLSEMPSGRALNHWGGPAPAPIWTVMVSEGYGEFTTIASGATAIEALQKAAKQNWEDVAPR